MVDVKSIMSLPILFNLHVYRGAVPNIPAAYRFHSLNIIFCQYPTSELSKNHIREMHTGINFINSFDVQNLSQKCLKALILSNIYIAFVVGTYFSKDTQ